MAKEITSTTFEAEVLQADKPVVIDFHAEWCGPCQKMAPHYEELATELADSYKLVKINIDEERDIAIAHAISSIPTLVFYKNGEKIASEPGYLDKSEIQAKIKQHLG